MNPRNPYKTPEEIKKGRPITELSKEELKEYRSAVKHRKDKYKARYINPRKFMVESFMQAYVTRKTANALYDKIREDIMLELLKGNDVVLFGIAKISPVPRELLLEMREADPERYRFAKKIRTKIQPQFAWEFAKEYV